MWTSMGKKAVNHSVTLDLGLLAPDFRDVSQDIHLLWGSSLDTHCGLQGIAQMLIWQSIILLTHHTAAGEHWLL